MKAIRRFSVRTVLPSRIEGLGVLASNLRWSWHPPTRDLFESISARKWAQAGEDPVKLLSRLSSDELAALAADDEFVGSVVAANEDLHHYLSDERWYQSWSREQEAAGKAAPAAIAYFSPEFGITSVLPQYSGGLGILAGDHLKTASDLGVPIVGVGLFYKTGYFKQSLNRDGWQVETYPVLDPDGLPLSLLREEDGTPAVVTVSLPAGRQLHAHVWKAQVGRVPLLLLDSDVPGNDEQTRKVTESLYGGGGDTRLEQELLLGIGGVRALRLWSRLSGDPTPEVYHTNEGHAGFLGVERITELVRDHGLTFDEALEAVRAATVFTTHTPVPAGIDRFDAAKINLFFGGANAIPGVPVERLLALGAEDYEGGQPGIFNMAVMGLRLAQRANGVSQLHGVVSREMFDGLWPGFDDVEVPITSITNGVHAPTWVDRAVYDVARKHLGTTDISGDERLGAHRRGARRRRVVDQARDAREARRRRPTTRQGLVAEAWRERRRARLGRRHPRPRRADDRLRPARADVQAPHPDAARPRAAQAPPAPPGAAGAARHRRQVAPGRRDRQAPHPGDGPLRRRPRGASPHRLPAQLRHRDGPAPLPGLRRLAQQPAAPVRGVRHVGHEGRAQRRPQPLDPRRLVGRVVRRSQRLGDPDRRRRRGRRPA